MALFDLLSPLFLGVDNLLEPFTNSFFRISLWALLSAFVTSIVFKKLSNPDKISTLKSQLKTKQNELNHHEGEFSELRGLAAETMKLSLKRMGLTFLPAMLASLPIIFVLTYLSNYYELITPRVNEPVPMSIQWQETQKSQTLQIRQNSTIITKGQLQQLPWQNHASELQLSSTNEKIVSLPFHPSAIIHKKQWWNTLVANPAGYLPDSSPIEVIHFDFAPQKIINLGPEWMHGWLFVFFFMTFVFSIGFLFLLKIKF